MDHHQEHEQTLNPDQETWVQVINPYDDGGPALKFKPDGSFIRYDPVIVAHPTGEQLPPGSSDPALSKDVPLNKSHNTFIRIFKPITTTTTTTTPTSKLPVFLYIHGGGFAFDSVATPFYHKFCAEMAAELPAIVLSLEYRKAPEHRLPAAYDDAVDAFVWVRDQAREPTETWLDQADFSNCFIMGTSAGGNIAFHTAIRVLELDLNPIKFSGLILDQPGFNGEERTESEMRMMNDKYLPLTLTDLLYKMALPEGANRDHEYSNPIKMKGKGKGLPRCFINGYLGDRLIDRQRVVAEMLEEEGVTVVRRLGQEGYHGIDLVDSDERAALFDVVKRFVYES